MHTDDTDLQEANERAITDHSSFTSVLSVLVRGMVFPMITGLHAILYSPDADKIRTFLRDVLGLKSVDAGHGWLIFAAPPTELAAHPTERDEKPRHELYLMCDDLKATIKELSDKGVRCSAI